jgi:ankyrin repeat protein
VTGDHKAAAKWLLQQGVVVNAGKHDGYTALHRASATRSGDDASMIKLLLAHGTDVHKRTAQLDTALDVAANTGHVKCAKALIAAGTDVNNVDSGGARTLDHAIIMHRSAVAQVLLQHGATAVMNDLKYTNCAYGEDCCIDGLTALMMCTEVDTLKVLLAAGACKNLCW